MGTFIHKFENQAAFEAVYNGSGYTEPWTSLVEGGSVAYNKPSQPGPTPHDYSQDYLTFVFSTTGSILSYDNRIYLSKDNGVTWVNGEEITNLNPGDKVLVKGEIDNPSESMSVFYCEGEYSVEGNVMSVVDPTGFRTRTNFDGVGKPCSLFGYCIGLTSAENLVFPATTLTRYCYSEMFRSCTSLTTAPELPATVLAESCYSYMFIGCTSLTTAPELPATTLATSCYNSMFYNCTSLTTAPELPATTLENYCYGNMFRNCSSLNYIKCLATDISTTDCTNDWVYGISNSGTFVKDASMTGWTTGDDGIPTNWTVQDV